MKPLIITIAGKKQVGKNTTGDLIEKLLRWQCGQIDSFKFNTVLESYGHTGFHHQKICPLIVFGSFAEALKEHCITLEFVTELQCYGLDEDKNSLSQCWKGDRQLTAREVLQEVGQFHRGLNPDCWVKALNQNYQTMRPFPALFIITDGRYPNELQWTENQGGKVIYLQSNIDTGNHPSERSLSLENHKDLIDLAVPGKGLMGVFEREKVITPVVLGWFKEYGLVGEAK